MSALTKSFAALAFPFLVFIALAFTTMLTACQRDAAPSPEDAAPTAGATDAQAIAPAPATTPPGGPDRAGQPPSTIEIPPADTPTPDIAAGAQITYTCKDGSELHVVYSARSVKFALTDGTVASLPRAESASKGGGDVYVGDDVALQRLGNVVQVEEHGGEKRVCAESGGNA